MIVILPMAGRGSRFTNHGFQTPKPLIEVAGKPMVCWALKSLVNVPVRELIVIALREHDQKFGVGDLISNTYDGIVRFVWLDEVTEGQLCTVLSAKPHLDPDEDVLVCASDTLVESGIHNDITRPEIDGLISVASLPGEQWSFAKTDALGNVVEVAEKKRISDNASTGLYYFRRAKDLLNFGEEMVRKEEKTRGEYFVIPVYQKMINAGRRIGISSATAMWDMGTPAAKEYFETTYPFH